ncbi:MAG: hypothetical protein PHS93_00900 [Candidatus Omnitrophica bacterium]|nr:hypothetical protein [Candidatus Omnitrophota bacterium]MDD5351711.1 hypothetical protein [Candidatus Omnitrophota bacterium]MDD5550921.1 hypothetical protein [Candidatus Omnitrophota bacterium]
MVKIARKIVLILCAGLIIFTNGLTLCLSKDFDNTGLDDLERSMKNMEMMQKQDTLIKEKDFPKYQFPKPPEQTFKQDLMPLDQKKKDRAAIRNEQRWQELMHTKRVDLMQNFEGWLPRIAREYRFLIELLMIALAITFFGLMAYRRKIKQQEDNKAREENKEGTTKETYYHGYNKYNKGL